MGSRMAANLARAGFELTVYNRTKDRAEPVLALGAKWAGSPAEAARSSDVVVTMLSTPEAVRGVALGEEGVLKAMTGGSLWMDCSTVNPSFSREMARHAQAAGVRFLDAPVGGTKGPAGQGTLIMMVGGDEEDVEWCRPIFDVVGQRTVHAGGHGMGSSLKMVVNLMLGTSMAVFAEGMLLGESLGLGRQMLLAAVPGSPVAAPFIELKKEMIESGDYDAHFPLQWMHKDLHLAAVSAYEQGVALPTVNAAKELFQSAVQAGYGEKDFAALFQYVVGE